MLPDQVVQARTAATEAAKTAGASASAEPTISDVLRQKITEAYSSSQDIVKPLDIATQDYLGAPQQAREKYQNIFNPFQRENLVTQYTGNKSLPMLSLSSILGQRFGRIEDTIGAGTRGYQAQVAAEQAKAQQANDLYTALLNEYKTVETIKAQQEADKLAREKFEYDKKSGSGGLTPEILKLLGIGQDNTTTTDQQDEWEVIPETSNWVTELGGQDLSTWKDPLQKQQNQNINLGGIDLSGIDLSKVLGNSQSVGLTRF